jgi:adenylate cyclase
MASSARLAVYSFGAFVLDCGNETLRTADGTEIFLRPKSFALLRLMVENAGRLLMRETIMEALWPNIFVTDDNITQCVLDVRRALGCESNHLLRTVRRRGYIFDATAVLEQPGPSAQVTELIAFRTGEAAQSHDATQGERAALTTPTSFRQRLNSETRDRLSFLILPLKSLEGSSAHECLAEIITENLLAGLAGHLTSLAPGDTQVLFHDDRLTHWPTAPHDCPVDYVLRGSVQWTSVTVQLLDAANGACIWTEQCELGHRRHLVARLVHGISIAVLKDVGRRVEALPMSGLTVHDLLTRGRAWMLRPSSAFNKRQALCCFERALAMQPDSMVAKLGIATAMITSVANGFSQTIEQDEARAEALLLEILAADPDIGLAHLINGTMRRLQGRLYDSRADLEVAMTLAPHSAMSASQLGMTLMFLGQPETAIGFLEKSVRVAAHDPQKPLLLTNLAMCHLMLGDVDTAVDQLGESATGNPQLYSTPLLLAAGLGLKSAPAEAGANIRQAAGLCPTMGTLSGARNWVQRQGSSDFMPIYQHTIERGLRQAGMPEE